MLIAVLIIVLVTLVVVGYIVYQAERVEEAKQQTQAMVINAQTTNHAQVTYSAIEYAQAMQSLRTETLYTDYNIAQLHAADNVLIDNTWFGNVAIIVLLVIVMLTNYITQTRLQEIQMKLTRK